MPRSVRCESFFVIQNAANQAVKLECKHALSSVKYKIRKKVEHKCCFIHYNAAIIGDIRTIK